MTHPEVSGDEPAELDASAVDFTQTPQFRMAVADAAAAASREAVQQFLTELQIKAAPKTDDPTDLMQKLAMHIAELTDQGSGRKPRESPEVVQRREKAHDRMVELIKKARAEGRVPAYRLVNKTVLAEQLIDPFFLGPDKIPRPTEIEWFGKPNDAMQPISDAAREIYAAYREWVGDVEETRALQNQPLWMTSGGLVVRGAPMARRVVGGLDAVTMEQQAPPIPSYDGFKVRQAIDPTASHVRVLGTVAEPARQNYAGAT